MQTRPLEFFETLLYYGHLKNVSQMTCSLKLHGAITDEMVQAALKAVFVRHPLLRSKIMEKNKILSFEIQDDFAMIPIEFVDKKNPNDFETLLERECNQDLPLEKTNWSVVVLRDPSSDKSVMQYDFIFHVSHVIADGLSLTNLIQEVARCVDQQVRGERVSLKLYRLYPAMEKLLQPRLNLTEFLMQQKKTNPEALQLKKLDVKKQTTEPYATEVIEKEQLQQLIQSVKNEGVSLNAFLNVTLLRAYQKTSGHQAAMSLGSAVNLRKRVKPPIPFDIAGNYFSAMTSHYSKEELAGSPWLLAKSYQGQLKQYIKKKKYLPSGYRHKIMNTQVRDMMKPAGETLSERVGSSYMGNIDFNLESIQVSDVRVLTKDADQINLLVYGFNNEIRLTFCYPRAYREASWVEQLRGEFMRLLEETA